ncbi:MAG: isochorismate synthase [Phycisphaerae bacterium]|nr:isochorismate synthase [Phycisphaerae bacterium]
MPAAINIIANELIAKIRALAPKYDRHGPKIYRFEADIDDILIFDWLICQGRYPKFYFSNRKNTSQLAALGIADMLTDRSCADFNESISIIQANLNTAEGAPRYFASIAFDKDGQSSPEWQKFARFNFILPKFELRFENHKTTFAYNLMPKQGESLEEIIANFQNSIMKLNFKNDYRPPPFTINPQDRVDQPTQSQWNSNVSRAIESLNSDELGKIVLARKTVLQSDTSVDAPSLAKYLFSESINTYDFYYQPDINIAFMGSSPECLFRKNNDNIYTEAIAGTCLTGDNDIQKRHYGNVLTNSAKDTQEHQYVIDDINEALNRICSEITAIDRRDIVSLSSLQHFRSRFSGKLKNNVNLAEIIQTLHPTAAVNGYQRKAAKAAIGKYEDFNRGLYAGPIGWLGKDTAEFAVAIRSALVQENKIFLFAGAGIVHSSDPIKEWDEIEYKIKPFLKLLEHYG